MLTAAARRPKLAQHLNMQTGNLPPVAAANGLQGSGWGVLGYDTLGRRLLTFQLYDQQANVPLGIIPLLQVDTWEHAYYLHYKHYKNVKADDVKAFWNVVNWEDVQKRFAAATSKASGLIF